MGYETRTPAPIKWNLAWKRRPILLAFQRKISLLLLKHCWSTVGLEPRNMSNGRYFGTNLPARGKHLERFLQPWNRVIAEANRQAASAQLRYLWIRNVDKSAVNVVCVAVDGNVCSRHCAVIKLNIGDEHVIWRCPQCFTTSENLVCQQQQIMILLHVYNAWCPPDGGYLSLHSLRLHLHQHSLIVTVARRKWSVI